MRIVTWNVNSLKVRLPRVLELCELHAPDVLLLQETKSSEDAFPVGELALAGYHAVHQSAGGRNGVAIVARAEHALDDPVRGLPGEARPEEARWIEATVGGMRLVCTYVTNGQALGTEVFAEKLAFFDAAIARATALGSEAVIGGDLNVTRADLDVYDPAAFAGGTHVSAEERGRLEALIAAGPFADAHRHVHPDEQVFTWWDYRQGHFHRGLGLRIDYLLASATLVPRIERCSIERDFRKGTKPSDHAPLVLDLACAP